MEVDVLLLLGIRSCVNACVVVVNMAAKGRRRSRQEEEEGRRLRRHGEAGRRGGGRNPGAPGMAWHGSEGFNCACACVTCWCVVAFSALWGTVRGIETGGGVIVGRSPSFAFC